MLLTLVRPLFILLLFAHFTLVVHVFLCPFQVVIRLRTLSFRQTYSFIPSITFTMFIRYKSLRLVSRLRT